MNGDEYLNITRSKDGVHEPNSPRTVSLRESVHEARHIALAANVFWDLDVTRIEILHDNGVLETIERTK